MSIKDFFFFAIRRYFGYISNSPQAGFLFKSACFFQFCKFKKETSNDS